MYLYINFYIVYLYLYEILNILFVSSLPREQALCTYHGIELARKFIPEIQKRTTI